MKVLELRINDELVCLAGRDDALMFGLELSAHAESGNGSIDINSLGNPTEGISSSDLVTKWPTVSFETGDSVRIELNEGVEETSITKPIEYSEPEVVDKADPTMKCSFCGKGREEVKSLVAGANVLICNGCNDMVTEINAQSE